MWQQVKVGGKSFKNKTNLSWNNGLLFTGHMILGKSFTLPALSFLIIKHLSCSVVKIKRIMVVKGPDT